MGTCSLLVAVTEAYNQDGVSINITVEHGPVTVVEESEPYYLVSYHSEISLTSIKEQGEVFTYQVYSYSMGDLVASDYEILNDWTLLGVKEVRIGSALLREQVINAINTSQAGLVRITYASTVGLSSAIPLFEIDFEVIADRDDTSLIQFFFEKQL